MAKLRLTHIINNKTLPSAAFIIIIIFIHLSEANPEKKMSVSLEIFHTI